MKSRRAQTLILGAAVFVLAAPLLVALIALHRQQWFPILDLAGTEMRVRAVLSSHPPLVGLYGRIGSGRGGSHPGPLSFYMLWPVWKLFGESSFGLQAATVALDVAAIALCVWIACRRGGLRVVALITPVLAVLLRAYGAFLLTLPWNPYLPVLWWIVFLLAVWSILSGDLALLPLVAFAGTMCVQTHISYLGLVAGMTLFVVAALLYRWHRLRDPSFRRRLVRWGTAAVVLAIVLWIPPVIDEFTPSAGNGSTIVNYFRHPPSAPVGLRRGLDAVLTQMDPVKLFTHTLVRDQLARPASGSRLSGMFLLIVWGISVVLARRLRERLLLQLDLVLAVAFVLSVASAARVFGELFFYLVLWAWGIAALMIFAIVYSIDVLVHRPLGDVVASKVPRLAASGAIAATVTVSAVFAFSAAEVKEQSPHINATLAALAPPAAHALARLRAGGRKGPYLITWAPDPERIGSAGYGLVNELERRGLNVRSDARLQRYVPYATAAHVMDPARAGIEIHLATGEKNIAHWRGDDRYREIAFYDPRSAAERIEFDGLRTEVIRELLGAKLADKVTMVDHNLFILFLTPIPAHTRDLVARMIALDMPSAVFIGRSLTR